MVNSRWDFSPIFYPNCIDLKPRKPLISPSLKEDDPKMIARFIVFLYSLTYPMTSNEAKLSADSVRQLLVSSSQTYCDQSAHENLLAFHASLYGVADKFECESLKEACKNAYVRALRRRFSIPDFISSINVVYETTPEADTGLRKWAVFVAQGYKPVLQAHPGFKALFTSKPDFSWDLATAYAEDQVFWCTECEEETLQPHGCICGQNGMCLKTSCTGEVSDFSCPECHSTCVQPRSLSLLSDDPRSCFKSEQVEDALKAAIEQMEE